MNLSAPFIARPVATTLLTLGILAAGLLAFTRLPVSPLPQVDFPTISVQAQMPGASPDTMAASVASPLERHLGQIADVTQMTSQSSVGSSRITLQFGLDRDINGAARDVQAAINAARADLPTSLRSNPTYRKVNPADAPVLILALTSKTLTRGQLYDAASNVLEQKLSQVDGVGQVIIGGAALPAVRVELNPQALFKYGIGLEDVRAALAAANANSPKGAIEDAARRWQIYTNDQATLAADYRPLVVAWRNGAAVRLSDVADVEDSVEDLRNAGLFNGEPSVSVIVFRQPGANIIDTVDRVEALLPQLKAAMPSDVEITPAADRSTTIRASLHDTERTLLIAVGLVILVVFAFLRDLRATLVPAVAVPVSIVGTFAAMYLLGFSLDNLSLMALTVATGFVVDDAIVVLENITRYLEEGMSRREAALRGAREVGFTVVSISLSLIAVFIPILLMGGLVGRLFREFALTLSLAIMVSLAISLTTTPMMCAIVLRARSARGARRREGLLDRVVRFYGRTLRWTLDRGALAMLALAATVALNVWLLVIIPKGFFPQQDTGRLIGRIQADQSTSFQAMSRKLTQMLDIVQSDPAVESVVGFTGGGGGGGGSTNTGSSFVSLKPLASGRPSADRVIARLRRRLAEVPGAQLFLQSVQDIRVGGRQSNAQYEYTLQGDSTTDLYAWVPRITQALQRDPNLADVNSDQQQKGLETDLVIDRPTAARLGVTPSQIDNTLYDAFGQRQVSTIYKALNQYHVVMEVAPRYWQDPQILRDIWVSTSGGAASGSQTSNLPAGTVSAAGSGRGSAAASGSGAGTASRGGAAGAVTAGAATGPVAGSATGFGASGSAASASVGAGAAGVPQVNPGSAQTIGRSASSGTTLATSGLAGAASGATPGIGTGTALAAAGAGRTAGTAAAATSGFAGASGTGAASGTAAGAGANAGMGAAAGTASAGTATGTAGTGVGSATGTGTAGNGGGSTGGGSTGGTGTASSTGAVTQSAARNQAQNAIAASGRSGASAGAAVSTAAETMVPLSAFSRFGPGNTPLAVNHQGMFVASTISFNLPPGKSLSDATAAIDRAMAALRVPATIHGSFQGTAQVFQESLANQPILIATALAAVYIVLGILYESTIHPVTILSTLPSAGLGAVLSLLLFGTEFSIIALIGVILLIGIVKKNAILMIDFALQAEREQGMDTREAITQASLLRFRPILMTTMAALLGAVPLALSFGDGAEIRRPLGISIVGGLIVSQVLTLYTTPVLYVAMDRFRLWALGQWRRAFPRLAADAAPEAGE